MTSFQFVAIKIQEHKQISEVSFFNFSFFSFLEAKKLAAKELLTTIITGVNRKVRFAFLQTRRHPKPSRSAASTSRKLSVGSSIEINKKMINFNYKICSFVQQALGLNILPIFFKKAKYMFSKHGCQT